MISHELIPASCGSGEHRRRVLATDAELGKLVAAGSSACQRYPLRGRHESLQTKQTGPGNDAELLAACLEIHVGCASRVYDAGRWDVSSGASLSLYH